MDIGDKFYKPIEDWKDYSNAAHWCNNNNAHIEDKGDYYEIVENSIPIPTKGDLNKFVYDEKCKIAYGGVTIVKDGNEYLFETAQDSITMCNAQTNAFIVDETIMSVDWKVYQNNFPVLLTLTRAQFAQILAFGMQMINNAFAVEGDLNQEIAEMTEEQLKDKEHIANFKARAESSFGQIPRRFVITAAQA